MNKHKHKEQSDADPSILADNAPALMVVTADVPGEKVGNARKRIPVAFETGRDKAVGGAKTVSEAVRDYPYQAVAIGVGVGTLIGYMLARRSGNNVRAVQSEEE